MSSSVKCGCFHSAVAEALATAYSKEISNEICREASKTLVMLSVTSHVIPPHIIIISSCTTNYKI